MTRIMLLTTAIVAGLAVSHGAYAFGGRPDVAERPEFTQLDADGDGKVTAAEMQAFPAARIAERFRTADTNGDGVVDRNELAAAADNARAQRQAQRVDHMMARFDADGDGAISEQEMTAIAGRNRAADPGARFIGRFDTDGDGAISEQEYAAAAQFMQMNRDPGGRRDMRRGGPDGFGGQRGQRGGDAPFWRN